MVVDHIDLVVTLVSVPQLLVRSKLSLDQVEADRSDYRFHRY